MTKLTKEELKLYREGKLYIESDKNSTPLHCNIPATKECVVDEDTTAEAILMLLNRTLSTKLDNIVYALDSINHTLKVK
jgi:hypothetical protein